MSKKFRSVYPTDGKPASPPWPGTTPGHPLLFGGLVCGAAALASFLLPPNYASSGVAFCFLGATYLLCLRQGALTKPEAFGLSLGGLMNPEPLSMSKMVALTGRALGIATGISLLILPLFWLGFLFWHGPTAEFDVARAFTWQGESAPVAWLREMLLWHVFAVALPEEAFFRGYLQSSLAARGERRISLLGVPFGSAIIVTSALFALGHLATDPHPARLAVFFPSLLFGLTRNATGGIGAAVFLHAECNLFSQWLGQGYGLY